MLVMRESGSSVSFAYRWWEVHSHDGLFYGFQGSDGDVAQFELTNQLFDAVLGEFAVVARQQLMILVGDFNVEPTQIPCLSNGISARLWVDLEAAWTSVSVLPQLSPVSAPGVLVVVVEWIAWLGALVLLPLWSTVLLIGRDGINRRLSFFRR